MTKPVANASRPARAAKTSSAVQTSTKKAKPRRLAVAFFYDEHGIVDEYMLHLVRSLQPFVEKTIFVSNGPLSRDSELAVRAAVETLVIRENIGFDVWAYKAALELEGFENLDKYDEVILYNHTFYGPIYPFSEMFDEMEGRPDDFWGISIHKAIDPNPFPGGTGVLPLHINSHFIAVRKPLLTSYAFRDYWEKMAPINSYTESVLKHESRFTKYFSDLGYKFSSYIDPDMYGSLYPVFIDIDEVISDRCPILKRRIFFHDPLFHETNAINLPRALRMIRETSNYDFDLIWRNIGRSTQPRVLATTASMTSVLPDVRLSSQAPQTIPRIAVCAHVYYVDMMDELLSSIANIKSGCDFIITTDTEKKKNQILSAVNNASNIRNTIVFVVEENRGRDMSALFITCRDIFLDDNYDLVCRIHTKKTPQISKSRSGIFKRHLMENLLNSPGYVDNLLDLFNKNPAIGLIIPPIVHISYATMGHSWFSNRKKTEEICRLLEIDVPLDVDTPVAAYGTMFWFRPAALRKLFAHQWKWSDFNAEPHHIDGSLAHAMERVLAYVVQDARFVVWHAMTMDQASQNYTALEYKFQKIQAESPNHYIHGQIDLLQRWKAAGYPVLSAPGVIEYASDLKGQTNIKAAARALIGAMKRSVMFRSPKAANFLAPFYRAGRRVLTLGRR